MLSSYVLGIGSSVALYPEITFNPTNLSIPLSQISVITFSLMDGTTLCVFLFTKFDTEYESDIVYQCMSPKNML